MDPYKSQIKKLIRHGSLKVIQKISNEEDSRDETKCQWWMFGEKELTPLSHKLSQFKQKLRSTIWNSIDWKMSRPNASLQIEGSWRRQVDRFQDESKTS
jgi:hypothetical protein